MNECEISGIADGIAAAIENDTPPPRLSDAYPEAGLASAYRVQDAVIERLRDRFPITGYKAGLTAPPAQAVYAVDAPVTGVLLRGDIDPSRRTFAALATGEMRLETEIGFRTATVIDRPIDEADIPRVIASSVAAVEIVQDRLAGGGKDVRDLVAVNVNARAVLLGDEIALERDDLNRRDVVLSHDGSELHRAPGGSVLGDQFAALRYLVNEVVRRGYRIRAGAILLTGAIGGLQPGEPGAWVAGYGGVQITFEITARNAGKSAT